MTALRELLLAQIARDGPMSVADYMTACLLHPDLGYYATRNPFGASGDFITAPEISQMFGELIGLWLAQTWLDQGAPDPFALAELGPGRGVLMADILRATARVPGFHAAMDLHLVEASPVLREIQRKAVAPKSAAFHDQIVTLPEAPLFLVANEFFDALPIRQYQRGAAGWLERQIGVEAGDLIWGLAPERGIRALDGRLQDTTTGQIVEHCPAAEAIAGEIGHRIAQHGGVALIIDYGDQRSIGDTFQALKNHDFTDPLAEPGEADLTAHVAFGPLAHAARPARATRLTPQGVFLEKLGITDRARKLAEPLTGDALKQHIAAHRRLTHPDEMGHLFKVLSLTPPNAEIPPALEPASTS
ncbi:MAG: SAM-dependent methyltransferase [Pseudomonadota bacterium]